MVTFKDFKIDPEAGIVYGLRGKPLVKETNGYVRYLTRRGRVGFLAHRLIWESVYGPIPSGMQINHINGIKHDNRICNLEVVTPKENTLHSYRAGLRTAIGEKNGRAKLTEADVIAIRNSHMPIRKIAELMGVSITTVSQTRSGRKWKHVPLHAAKGEA